QKRVFAISYGIVRDQEAALDITQETFIKAHRSLEGFQGSSSFYSWLYRIATNLAIDHRRAQKRTQGHAEYDDELGSGEEGNHTDHLTPEYSRSSPDKELERREVAELLDQGLEQLTDKLRAVFILR